jgi:hypothetical protein
MEGDCFESAEVKLGAVRLLYLDLNLILTLGELYYGGMRSVSAA